MVLLLLDMSIGSKLQVFIAFSFRLPLTVLSMTHLLYSEHYNGSKEPQFTVANEVMLQQALLIWSLVSATIPSMKPFVRSFSMNMGFGAKTRDCMCRRTVAEANVFALQTIGSMPAPRAEVHSGRPISREANLDWRGDQSHTETDISGGSQRSSRPGGENRDSLSGSEDMIIST